MWPAGETRTVLKLVTIFKTSLFSLIAWLTATDWPAGGEIDIVEGVHNEVLTR